MNRRDVLKGGLAIGFLTFADMQMTALAWAAKKTGSKLGVIAGATPIDQGMAIHANDITIFNDRIAASFAVGSNNYWNMTSGSILDLALMQDGKPGVDLVNDVEFLNDLWSASGSYNGENLLKVPTNDVSYEELPGKIVVTAKTRYWTSGHKYPLNVDIQYTLEEGKNYISLKTTVHNPKGNEPYENMHSGYSLSTLAAHMFGPFGYYPDVKVTGIAIGADKDVQEEYGQFIVTYDENYAVSIQMDNADAYKGSSGYKDLYVKRDILPGESYVYTGEILIVDKGETSPVVERYLEKNPSTPSAQISGSVVNSTGKAVPGAYVIVSKKGSYKETELSHGKEQLKKDILQPFVWKIADAKGDFSFRLPHGEYQLHVEARGYTPSDKTKLALTKDEKVNFKVNDGAKAVFSVYDENNKLIPAKVRVEGVVATVGTLGGTVFFSGAADKRVEFDVAAPENELSFIITHNSDFESLPVVIKKKIKPREVIKEKVVIPTLINAKAHNWYNADNHQHSDIGDGATPIEELYRAQLAAGLDLHIVSDHDSMGNNATMAKLSKGGRPFISSIEVSPGWGHWNILNADYSKTPVSPNLTPAEIIKAGHEQGGLVVMNHPFTDYGFLNNRDGVKGGYDEGSDDFDFLEIQSTIDLTDKKNMDKKALDAAMDYWNKGKKIYLSAGSDQHNAKSGLYPGKIRMYAHITDKLSVQSYLKSMKQGSTYVTMGPILLPDSNSMFGSTKKIKAGEKLSFKLNMQSVYGLMSVETIGGGVKVDEKNFNNATGLLTYEVTVSPQKNTWFNFVVRDAKGHYAVSNPIWVELV